MKVIYILQFNKWNFYGKNDLISAKPQCANSSCKEYVQQKYYKILLQKIMQKELGSAQNSLGILPIFLV